jgi:hypothetical protein
LRIHINDSAPKSGFFTITNFLLSTYTVNKVTKAECEWFIKIHQLHQYSIFDLYYSILPAYLLLYSCHPPFLKFGRLSQSYDLPATKHSLHIAPFSTLTGRLRLRWHGTETVRTLFALLCYNVPSLILYYHFVGDVSTHYLSFSASFSALICPNNTS